jgi:hypothetical protein
VRGSVSRALGLSFAIATALACQTGYYQEYLAAHPGFDPTLPREGVTLPELLAALHAPQRARTSGVGIAKLWIYRADADPWEEIPLQAIRRGEVSPSDAHDYAVLVAWTCHFEAGLQKGETGRGGFYLLPKDRLAAWDHHEFRDRCRVDNEFRAARGALIETERQATQRLTALGVRYSLVQAYQRGLAYVEAGRLDDARGMLVLGERTYRPARLEAQAKARARADDATEDTKIHKEDLAEAERLRAALMRALGVEEVKP